MYLEKLISIPKENLEEALSQLTEQEQTALYNEIAQKDKEYEQQKLIQEANLKNLSEQEEAQMQELQRYGITSKEQLEAEIEKLEQELNANISNYIDELRGDSVC